jgi:hypothetical protein
MSFSNFCLLLFWLLTVYVWLMVYLSEPSAGGTTGYFS